MEAVAEPTESAEAAERGRLILAHLPQVLRIARRIHRRLPPNVCLEDLVSTGVLSLIGAVDRFQPSRDLRMNTYAEHRIQGGILDDLRRADWAPRMQRHRAKQIDAAIAAAGQRLQRTPTEEEVAAELHLALDRYHQWQVDVRGVNLARLSAAARPGEPETRSLLDCLAGDPEMLPSAILERKERQHALAEALAKIPVMERKILGLHYAQELTLRQIAGIARLHESRISQLKNQAIRRLRGYLTHG